MLHHIEAGSDVFLMRLTAACVAPLWLKLAVSPHRWHGPKARSTCAWDAVQPCLLCIVATEERDSFPRLALQSTCG